jgi:hypothetical protein
MSSIPATHLSSARFDHSIRGPSNGGASFAGQIGSKALVGFSEFSSGRPPHSLDPYYGHEEASTVFARFVSSQHYTPHGYALILHSDNLAVSVLRPTNGRAPWGSEPISRPLHRLRFVSNLPPLDGHARRSAVPASIKNAVSDRHSFV